jgi:hypothetical protein
MTRLFLAAGVAALAITAPAASAPGGKGGHAQHSKSDRASVQRQSGKAAHAQRTRPDRTTRVASVQERGKDRKADRVQQTRKADRVQQARKADSTAVRQERRQARQDIRPQRATERIANVAKVQERKADRVNDRRASALAARETRLDRIANDRDRRLAQMAQSRVVKASEWNDLARGGVWLNGCPPGLAKKPVACVPPGQAAKLLGQPLSTAQAQMALSPIPQALSSIYRDTPDYYYRYGNGYAYQVNRADNVIRDLLPLFGLGYTVGQTFPASYPNYYMPSAYQPFYPDTPYTSYRYANGYMYQVDPITGLIEDVDPMMGYGYGYGQMMPATYSAYNVPYQYRPLYYDTSDSYYRYAPGAIYQVDPTTSLITGIAALLTGGMTIGQPLPVGYSAYNVPYAYRTTYYDTPDAMYRYSNGYIYRVDPATQLVSAIVASVLT